MIVCYIIEQTGNNNQDLKLLYFLRSSSIFFCMGLTLGGRYLRIEAFDLAFSLLLELLRVMRRGIPSILNYLAIFSVTKRR